MLNIIHLTQEVVQKIWYIIKCECYPYSQKSYRRNLRNCYKKLIM